MSNDINYWDQTPNLAESFHPVPKVFKAKAVIKPMKKIGKRIEAWLGAHPANKEKFEENGITSCEIFPYVLSHHKKLLKKYAFNKCKMTYKRGFAHVKPRANYDLEKLVDPHCFVLADKSCHDIVDLEMPNPEAEKLLQEIVDARGW